MSLGKRPRDADAWPHFVHLMSITWGLLGEGNATSSSGFLVAIAYWMGVAGYPVELVDRPMLCVLAIHERVGFVGARLQLLELAQDLCAWHEKFREEAQT